MSTYLPFQVFLDLCDTGKNIGKEGKEAEMEESGKRKEGRGKRRQGTVSVGICTTDLQLGRTVLQL